MKVFILVLSILLASCATASKPTAVPVQEAPVVEPTSETKALVKRIEERQIQTNSNAMALAPSVTMSLPSTTFAPTAPLVKSREFLFKYELEDFPVYGVLVFSSKPADEEEKKQYIQICNSWEATFLTKKELGLGKFVKTFTTYWPTNASKESQLNTCEDLYDYNYTYAQEVMQKFKITKPGPMLIAIYRTNGKDKHAVLYLNSLELEDINRAFQTWKFDLVVTQNGWSSTFTLTYFREKFRYLVKNYGKNVLEFKKG